MITKIFLFCAVLTTFCLSTASAAEWTLDRPHTSIKFKVKHIMTDIWGTFSSCDAVIRYDPDHPADAYVKVTIDVNSIDTGNEKRDNHLRSPDFFDIANFPQMTFESKKAVPTGDDKLTLIGDLTIRGISNEIQLRVEGPSDPITLKNSTMVAASAECTIQRANWGLTWNKVLETGNLLVGEDVTIVIDAELDKVK